MTSTSGESSDIWVVVPSAGRATLEPAIDSTGIPRERVVVVQTVPEMQPVHGCRGVIDLGPVNIHRWWNAGINAAVSCGGRYVAVINDDVRMDEHTLPTLLQQVCATGAAIASPGGGGLFREVADERRMVINGACWLLDTASGLRPDEGYRWWYGDNDIDFRARRDHGGVVSVRCYFEHLHPSELTATTPDLLALTHLDAQRWASR